MCLLWADAQKLPNTQSELYEEFVSFLWTKFVDQHRGSLITNLDDFLCSLGKLALEGLMSKENLSEERLVFDEADFLNHGEFEMGCRVGLLTVERLRSNLRVSRAVMFLHKSFQEYCAAYCWARLIHKTRHLFMDILARIDTRNMVDQKIEILKFCCWINRKHGSDDIVKHVIMTYRKEMSESSCVGVSDSECDIFSILELLYECGFPSNSAELAEALRSLLSSGQCLSISSSSSHKLVVWNHFVKSSLALLTLSHVKSIHFAHLDSLDLLSNTLASVTQVEKVSVRNDDNSGRITLTTDSTSRLGVCLGKLSQLSVLDLHVDIDITDALHHMCEQPTCTKVLQQIDLKDEKFESAALSQLLLHQTQLQTLKLCDIKLSDRCIKSVFGALQPSLVKLHLNNIKVGNAIGRLREVMPYIHALILRDTKLNENNIRTLCGFFPKAGNLVELDLSLNVLGAAVESLGCIISQLKLLELRGCHLKKDDIYTLCGFIAEAEDLSVLDLSLNTVGVAELNLVNSVKICRKLTHLNLHQAFLSDNGIVALAESFCCLTNLEKLELDRNCSVGEDGLVAVFSHLYQLPKLTHLWISAVLDISQCSALVRDCWIAIGKSIPKRPGIQVVDVDAERIASICGVVGNYQHHDTTK